MNVCRACDCDFSSVAVFDRHRVGRHAYLASPGRPDGRRCLSESEMVAKGWVRNKRGAWSDPASIEAVRMAFSATQSRSDAQEGVRQASETVRRA